MLSLSFRFLFVHVPKTGGNSIQSILRNYSEDIVVSPGKHQDGVERFEIRNPNYRISKHSPLSRYKTVLTPSAYESLFKFATIRNPWDRLVSFYFSPHRGATQFDRQHFVSLIHSVRPLRHHICEAPSTERNGLADSAPSETMPLDSDVDFLIRFENLAADFAIVCEKLNIPFRVLPEYNSSSHLHYSHYYDDTSVELVRERFREEIDFGGYSFEVD